MLRSRLTAFRALAVLGLCTAPAAAAPGRFPVPARFDGTWNVQILTESGACDRSYSYPVRIEGGQARFVGTSFAVSGQVTRNGAIQGSVSSGLATANVIGRLAVNGTGRGTWTSTGSLSCGGRWTARRRG